MATSKNEIARISVGERIRSFIVERFPLVRKRGLSDQDRLLETGFVDSMGVLEVVEFLESEFQLSVSDEELLPENFESVERLALFVQNKASR